MKKISSFGLILVSILCFCCASPNEQSHFSGEISLLNSFYSFGIFNSGWLVLAKPELDSLNRFGVIKTNGLGLERLSSYLNHSSNLDFDHIFNSQLEITLQHYGGKDEAFFSRNVQEKYIINVESPSSVYGWSIFYSGDFREESASGEKCYGRYACYYPETLNDCIYKVDFEYARYLYLLYVPEYDAILYVHIGDLDQVVLNR